MTGNEPGDSSMIALSVNVNKVATLRNSRGGKRPSVAWAVRTCIAAGARGITVHPRADQRHITPGDVREIAGIVRRHRGIEYNIEGDARPDLIDLVLQVRPDQCTLVPTTPGEVTSNHGWRFERDAGMLRGPIGRLKDAGIRVAAFVDAGVEDLELGRELGLDRIELYTEPYAIACEEGNSQARQAFDLLAATARDAVRLGMGVNAGHDLDLNNLGRLLDLPGLAEVSIGHALISDALQMGLEAAVRAYLGVLAGQSPPD